MDPVFRRFFRAFRAFRAVHRPGFEAEGEVRCWRGIANVDGSAGAQAAWKMPFPSAPMGWDHGNPGKMPMVSGFEFSK